MPYVQLRDIAVHHFSCNSSYCPYKPPKPSELPLQHFGGFALSKCCDVIIQSLPYFTYLKTLFPLELPKVPLLVVYIPFHRHIGVLLRSHSSISREQFVFTKAKSDPNSNMGIHFVMHLKGFSVVFFTNFNAGESLHASFIKKRNPQQNGFLS